MPVNDGYKCPACHKPLEVVTIYDIDFEACIDGCGGIWFDAAEIFRLTAGEIDESNPDLQKLLAFKRAADTENREKLTCMKCGIKMRRHEYRENSGVFVDECYDCGSIWLDGGELGAIRENPAVHASNAERQQIAKDFKKNLELDKARQALEASKRLRRRHTWHR